jgi:hypothetical protein
MHSAVVADTFIPALQLHHAFAGNVSFAAHKSRSATT